MARLLLLGLAFVACVAANPCAQGDLNCCSPVCQSPLVCMGGSCEDPCEGFICNAIDSCHTAKCVVSSAHLPTCVQTSLTGNTCSRTVSGTLYTGKCASGACDLCSGRLCASFAECKYSACTTAVTGAPHCAFNNQATGTMCSVGHCDSGVCIDTRANCTSGIMNNAKTPLLGASANLVCRSFTPTCTGYLRALAFNNFGNAGSAEQAQFGIYSDNFGTPLNLLTRTAPFSVTGTAVYSRPTISTPQVLAGTKYWICMTGASDTYWMAASDTYSINLVGGVGNFPLVAQPIAGSGLAFARWTQMTVTV